MSAADSALELWRASLAAAGRRPSAGAVAEQASSLADPAALLVVDGPGYALGRVEQDVLRLVQLVVHPASRRQGRGAALAEALADAAWPRGARRLVAEAADDAARAFLLAVGLEEGDEGLEAELEPPVRDLVLREAGLRLGQLLKLAGLVDTGAEGKALLESGEVLVDGEVETRRGRQVRDGEVVVARDQAVRVVLPPT